MVANQNLPTVMARDGLVDGSPTLGRLGKTSWCLSMFDPLPEQFGDVHRRTSICVGGKPALTPERAPHSHALRTALRTPLRGVPRTYQADFNAFLPSDLLQGLPKQRVGHPLDLAVRLSAEPRVVQPFEVFHGEGGGVLLGKGDDSVRLLVTPRLVEVVLVSPEFPKNAPRPPRAFGGVSLKLRAADAQVALDLPYVAPEVKLAFDFAPLENGHGGKGADPDIHADYCFVWHWFGNLELVPELGERPVVPEQLVEPLPCSVLGDGQTEPAVERGDAQD